MMRKIQLMPLCMASFILANYYGSTPFRERHSLWNRGGVYYYWHYGPQHLPERRPSLHRWGISIIGYLKIHRILRLLVSTSILLAICFTSTPCILARGEHAQPALCLLPLFEHWSTFGCLLYANALPPVEGGACFDCCFLASTGIFLAACFLPMTCFSWDLSRE